MFHTILRKLGVERTIAAILMIAVGVGILIWPRLLTSFIAVYLIVVGVIKLITD